MGRPLNAPMLSKPGPKDIDNRDEERKTIMKESKSGTKDPICGMTVDEATALHTECDGKTVYFCSDACQKKFMSTPACSKSKGKSGCCGG